MKDIADAIAARDRATDDERRRVDDRLRELDRQLFAPLTYGLYIPSKSSRNRAGPIRSKEPYISAFVLSDASAADLKRLGVQVRSQVGDVFSAFIPLSAISKLESIAGDSLRRTSTAALPDARRTPCRSPRSTRCTPRPHRSTARA